VGKVLKESIKKSESSLLSIHGLFSHFFTVIPSPDIFPDEGPLLEVFQLDMSFRSSYLGRKFAFVLQDKYTN
jgi:hypothetical protein